MNNDKIFWQFNPPIASLRCGPVAGHVDVSRPQLGLHDLRVNSTAIAGALLSAAWFADEETASAARGPADWPMPVADAYVRGGDLVATYGHMPNSPYSPQIYWRIEQGAGSLELGAGSKGQDQHDSVTARSLLPAPCTLSLLVSVQTDLLESHPRIRVTSRLAADEVIHELPGCVLWRLAGGELSYTEIVPDSDFQQLAVEHSADGLASAHWDLFAEFLEKGVIRRAQIQGHFLPRKRDLELAAACCLAAQRRPLPLTT